MPQTLRDVMTSDLVLMDASTNVRDAAQAMRDNDIGNVIVERDQKTCGIVTDRDLVVRCLADGEEGLKRDLGAICSGELATLESDSAVDEAIDLMKQKAVRRIPVLQKGRAVGIVSLGDLAQARDRNSALGEVSAAQPNR
jgi:signal-transduction protein with cAMP-binding, CBS, and nucleotidyltransferase domain